MWVWASLIILTMLVAFFHPTSLVNTSKIENSHLCWIMPYWYFWWNKFIAFWFGISQHVVEKQKPKVSFDWCRRWFTSLFTHPSCFCLSLHVLWITFSFLSVFFASTCFFMTHQECLLRQQGLQYQAASEWILSPPLTCWATSSRLFPLSESTFSLKKSVVADVSRT